MEKKESTYKGGKKMKTNKTDSKLENLDEARKRRAEHTNRLMDAFKFSDSDSDIQPSPSKRKSSVEEYDNHQVLDNFLEENVFTESENSERKKKTYISSTFQLQIFIKRYRYLAMKIAFLMFYLLLSMMITSIDMNSGRPYTLM